MLQYFARILTNQTLSLYYFQTLSNLRVMQIWYLRLKIDFWSILDVRQSITASILSKISWKFSPCYWYPLPFMHFLKDNLHGPLLNSKITYNFLCGQPVFLSFSFLPLWQYLLNRSKYYKHFKKSFSENIRVSTNYVSCKVFNCSGQIF